MLNETLFQVFPMFSLDLLICQLFGFHLPLVITVLTAIAFQMWPTLWLTGLPARSCWEPFLIPSSWYCTVGISVGPALSFRFSSTWSLQSLPAGGAILTVQVCLPSDVHGQVAGGRFQGDTKALEKNILPRRWRDGKDTQTLCRSKAKRVPALRPTTPRPLVTCGS